jgi:hypothetical protein
MLPMRPQDAERERGGLHETIGPASGMRYQPSFTAGFVFKSRLQSLGSCRLNP